MTSPQILNCIGLTSDIIGVIMLFKYGLPSEINKDGYTGIIMEQEDEEQKVKWKKYNFFSYIALTLFIIGFVFQFSSNFFGTTKTNSTSKNAFDFELNSTSKKLIGEWRIYDIGSTLCNACPKMNFNANGTAIVKLGGGNEYLKLLLSEIKFK
ncbi:MAG TPA: hypothetical protein VIJ92_01310 [Ginsengibacter sp.]